MGISLACRLGIVALAAMQGTSALADHKPAASSPLAPAISYPSRRPKQDPIWLAERHEMEVTYLGFPGLSLALEVLPFGEVEKRKVYRVRATARNSAIMGLFFKLDNSVESWFDFEGFFSYRLHLIQNQSDLKRDSLEVNDPMKAETVFTNKWQKKNEAPSEAKGVFPMPRFAQDTFSAFFFLRTLPLGVGSTFTVPVISEGNLLEVLVTVVRRENLEVDRRKTGSVVLKLEKLGKDGKPIPSDNFVWLSDDDRRKLLRVDVKTRFGHVVAHLRKFVSGLAP